MGIQGLSFSLQHDVVDSHSVSYPLQFLDFFIYWAGPSLAFIICTLDTSLYNGVFFSFFGEPYLKYIKPPEACPQHHRGWPPLAAVCKCDKLILKSIIGTTAFDAKDTEQSQGHSSLPPSPSWSELPFGNEIICGTLWVMFSSLICDPHAGDLSRPHTCCACLWALCGRRRDQTCICFCQRDLSPCHIRKWDQLDKSVLAATPSPLPSRCLIFASVFLQELVLHWWAYTSPEAPAPCPQWQAPYLSFSSPSRDMTRVQHLWILTENPQWLWNFSTTPRFLSASEDLDQEVCTDLKGPYLFRKYVLTWCFELGWRACLFSVLY